MDSHGKVVEPFPTDMLTTDLPITLWAPKETMPDPKDENKQITFIHGQLPENNFNASKTKIKIGDSDFIDHLKRGKFTKINLILSSSHATTQLQHKASSILNPKDKGKVNGVETDMSALNKWLLHLLGTRHDIDTTPHSPRSYHNIYYAYFIDHYVQISIPSEL